MYGKKMRDVHMVGFSMQSDRVVRFRNSDDKVTVADLLVGVGKYVSVSKVQELIFNWIDMKHYILNDLENIEVDKELMEKKVCTFSIYLNKSTGTKSNMTKFKESIHVVMKKVCTF